MAQHAPAPAHRIDNRLPGLDILRAIAALMVVIMHAGAIWPGGPHVASSSYLAVDFFFLLSGFVMGRTYERRMIAGTLGPWTFLIARYRRLWPTMTVGAVISIPFLWRDSENWVDFLAAALPNVLLLPSFAASVLFALNTPAWSIFFELAANLGHALGIFRLRQRELAAVALACFIALITCAIAYGTLDLGARPSNMGWGFARVGFSYALGLLLWRWHGDRPPLRVPPILALCTMPVLFVIADPASLRGAAFDLGFVALGGPLLLWGGLALRIAAIGLRNMALMLGATSFPLYAVHYPVLLGAEWFGMPIYAGPACAVAAGLLTTWAMGGFDHIKRTLPTF